MQSLQLNLPPNPSDVAGATISTAPEFRSGEVDWSTGTTPGTNAVQVSTKVIQFGVSSFLTKRRIYCWLYATGSVPTNFMLCGQISFWTSGGQTLLGSLPVCVAILPGGITGVSAVSLISLVNSGGFIMPNTMQANIAASQGGQPTSTILQPLDVDANCDTLSFDITSTANVSGMRCILACVSQTP